MKLAQRYHRANLLTSFIILIITAVIYYIAIHFILTSKLDKDLEIEEQEIAAYVKNYQQLPSPGNFLHQEVVYRKLKNTQTADRSFSYEKFYNEIEKRNEPGRSLVTSVMLHGNVYQVTISKSRSESNELIRFIFLITLTVTLLLLISLLLINRFVLQRIWSPFYATLGMMKAFNLTTKNNISPQSTKIDEFNELHIAVSAMAKRVKDDYSELKTFTDNAAHEMMTPLAVIISKLDVLLQGQPLAPEQGLLINEIYLAVGRLSRLNSSLLLLAKIENNLLPELEKLQISALVIQKIDQFQELLASRNITICHNLIETQVTMSKYLLDILLNNLLANAIKHNHTGGTITVNLSQTELTISNTGIDAPLNPLIFDRFYKMPSSDGMGLGLAIVKQIALMHHFKISYSFLHQHHIFKLTF